MNFLRSKAFSIITEQRTLKVGFLEKLDFIIILIK